MADGRCSGKTVAASWRKKLLRRFSAPSGCEAREQNAQKKLTLPPIGNFDSASQHREEPQIDIEVDIADAVLLIGSHNALTSV